MAGHLKNGTADDVTLRIALEHVLGCTKADDGDVGITAVLVFTGSNLHVATHVFDAMAQIHGLADGFGDVDIHEDKVIADALIDESVANCRPYGSNADDGYLVSVIE